MSQPFSRSAPVPAPGSLDRNLNEFWFENPWYIQNSQNLSAYERNRVFLNLAGRSGRVESLQADFVDISYLSGADSDGDGRSVVAADFRNCGQLDLVIRQTGGGPLIVYENQFPKQHWLEVSLRGVKSNRLGVGARLSVVAAGHTQVRELFPSNSYRSQMPSRVHFGLDAAERIERLSIRWPSGLRQTLTDLPVDRHIVVEEGSDQFEIVVPGEIIRP